MRRALQAGVAAVALVLPFVAPSSGEDGAPTRLLGFTSPRVEAQLDLEQRLDAAVETAPIVEWNRRMTRRPHHVGSQQARENAEWMREQLESWGFDARIETFHVLVPMPTLRELTLVEPRLYEARLQEKVIPEDSTSEIAIETGLPPYNAYSADGDVTGELVYVNQGVPRDYEELERLGIDVEGKVVIARYGGSWRGIKPKVAAERGAVACLLYNDPHEDGFFRGDTYPEGAYKHPFGVQRGSVLDLPLRPGDPLTPMRGATEGTPRLAVADAETLMEIPVLPLSWKDAQPLLEALGGPVAPPSWRGALPLTYHIGPGPARVRLRLAFDWSLRPAHNVIAVLEGEDPEQWIVRGNHHDAWVMGGRDPISGMVAVLAEARAVGRLARDGFRPRRSILYAAWDAEEPGLLGSTEWAEEHARDLRRKAAVYINSDSNGRGFLGVGGSHALESLVNEVAEAVEDPQTGVSVAERLRAARLVRGTEETRRRLLSDPHLRISALGSGSDYSPFLQHLGIASLNIGFRGESGGGEYHTAFDSHDFYRRFVDPGGEYGHALAKLAGRLTLRLANADLLPFDFRHTAQTVARYVDDVKGLAERERLRIEEHNRLLEEGRYELAADPTEPWVAPERETVPPHLNWAPLLDARDRLQKAAASLRLEPDAVADLAAANRLVLGSERQFVHERGLPRRPWFRHHIYAPGFYTGYGVKTLPGVREAIEEQAWDLAQEEIHRVAERIDAYAALLERITAL